MGLFSVHSNFLLLGLFVWPRLERRKLHFSDPLAARVLDLIYISSKRIPHRDLDLGTELSERERDRPQDIHLLAQKVAVSSFLKQWLAAHGSSVPGQEGHDESGIWELFLEIQQKVCSSSSSFCKAIRDLFINPI